MTLAFFCGVVAGYDPIRQAYTNTLAWIVGIQGPNWTHSHHWASNDILKVCSFGNSFEILRAMDTQSYQDYADLEEEVVTGTTKGARQHHNNCAATVFGLIDCFEAPKRIPLNILCTEFAIPADDRDYRKLLMRGK